MVVRSTGQEANRACISSGPNSANGLYWRNIGGIRPSCTNTQELSGRVGEEWPSCAEKGVMYWELSNAALSDALKNKNTQGDIQTFTEAEWESFGITDLALPHYIQSATGYFFVPGGSKFLSSTGIYESTDGKLTTKFVQEAVPETNIVFTFDVVNPPEGRPGATDIKIKVCRLPEVSMELGKINRHPGLIAGHIFNPVMYQDNPGARAVNKLTIQLNLFASLEAGDIITIFGLQGISLINTPNGTVEGEITVYDDSVQYYDACPIYTDDCQRSRSGTDYVDCDVKVCDCLEPEYSCAVYFWSGRETGAILATAASTTTPPPSSTPMPTTTPCPNGTSCTNETETPAPFNTSGQATPGPVQSTTSAMATTTPAPAQTVLTGSAWWDGSELKLYVKSQARASDAGRRGQMSIALNVLNPELAQASPTVEIEINGQNNHVPRQAFAKGVTYGENLIPPKYEPATTIFNTAPLLISGFIERLIYQRTPSSGAINTVTVVLQSYIDVTPEANGEIVVKGFTMQGQNQDSDKIKIDYLHDINVCERLLVDMCRLQQEEMEVFGVQDSADATLESTLGDSTLRLKVKKTMYANRNYSFSFTMQNQIDANSSPSVSIRIGGDYPSAWQLMEKLDQMRHPLLIAGFDKKTIHQSDPSTDIINTLFVTLNSNVNLLNNTYITIEGLVGTQTSDNDSFRIFGPFQHIFGSFGRWQQSLGQLVIQLQAPIDFGLDYVFWFKILNPKRGIIDAPDIYISADINKTRTVEGHPLEILAYKSDVRPYLSDSLDGDATEVVDEAINIARVLMTPAQNIREQALRVIDFLSITLRQTTVSSGELNNFTLTILPEVDVVSPFQVITIYGLTNTSTPTGQIPIVSPFTSFGNWSHENGTLIFALDDTLPRNRSHAFTFELRNPLLGQEAPVVSFRMTKTEANNVSWTASARNVEYPADVHIKPLHVATFNTKVIGQSNFRGSQKNVLTVTLVPNVDLGRPAHHEQGTFAITISGLENAQHPTGSIPLLIADSTACGGNCTVHFADAPNGTAGRGHWQGDSAGDEAIVLYIAQPLLALQTYMFAFEITNPAAGQKSPSVKVESHGLNSRISRMAMDKGGGDSDPLVIAGFVASMGQSTFSQGDRNVLTVTLIPHTYLAPGMRLTISGMRGALHPTGWEAGSSYSGLITLQESDVDCVTPSNATGCHLYFDPGLGYGSPGEGDWDDEMKTLKLRTIHPLAKHSVIAFSWRVYNANEGQDAPDIQISGEGFNVVGANGSQYNITLHANSVIHAPDVLDSSKCNDWDKDCCASSSWGEQQTCSDGYEARPTSPDRCPSKIQVTNPTLHQTDCAKTQGGIGCYGCFAPGDVRAAASPAPRAKASIPLHRTYGRKQ